MFNQTKNYLNEPNTLLSSLRKTFVLKQNYQRIVNNWYDFPVILLYTVYILNTYRYGSNF